MNANRSRGLILAVALEVGVASGACHDARPTADATRAGLAGGAASSDDTRQGAKAGAGGDVVTQNAGAPAIAGAAAEPIAAAVPPSEAISVTPLSGAVKANNEFGAALFGALEAQSAGKNFLTSPISASLALGMTYAGARGQTRTEMAHALRLGTLSDDGLLQGQHALSQALAQRGARAFQLAQEGARGSARQLVASDYSLEIVNSLWGQENYPWEPPFLKKLTANYGAGLFERNFAQAPQPTRLEINRWVSAHTNGKINDLLPESAITPGTRLVLVNALHLKLPWQNEFSKSATAPGPFTPSDGKEVSVPFMHRQAEFAYRDDGSAQIVGLPFSSRQLWLIIALPHAGVSLTDYERSLRADSPALIVPNTTALVTLALPKVTFTSPTFSLAGALKDLGMVQAFDPTLANFEGMCKAPQHIAAVLQKAMIALQESGVEAAAATAVIMGTKSLRLSDIRPVPIPMTVDRPYLLALVDQPTGALLMLGHIEEPTK